MLSWLCGLDSQDPHGARCLRSLQPYILSGSRPVGKSQRDCFPLGSTKILNWVSLLIPEPLARPETRWRLHPWVTHRLPEPEVEFVPLEPRDDCDKMQTARWPPQLRNFPNPPVESGANECGFQRGPLTPTQWLGGLLCGRQGSPGIPRGRARPTSVSASTRVTHT